MVPGATVNASGLSLDADQYNSMFQSQGTTRCATANSQQMLHSAMVLINTCLSGPTNITEDSGVFGVSLPGGDASSTGHSPSISEPKASY